MMKFTHRVAVLSVIGALTLIFGILTLSGQMGSLVPGKMVKQDSLKSFMSKNPILSGFKSVLASTNTCRREFRDKSGIVSTLDLAKITDYKVYVNGQYDIPHPKLADVAFGPNIEPLTVIILPHSHIDPGWQDTVDGYYNSKVKKILDNMVRKLHLYEDMTFIWAEIVYFSRWYEELSKIQKEQVQLLVKSGRLEFVSGGWVMPDEANTHYVSVIDQFVEGHLWLKETFGITPNNSWAVDPFGHSGTMPYILKKSGMSNMVIQRIHQATKGALVKNAGLEFFWKQYWDDSTISENILCHVNPYILYSLHHTCGPEIFTCAMFDFLFIEGQTYRGQKPNVDESNVAKLSEALYEQYRLKSGLFKYNTILVPLGDDFRYDHPNEWDQQYENYQKLMKYMNAKTEWKINVKFGTLTEYFKMIRDGEKQKSTKFPVLSGDFYPYSDKNSAYWTGYYSTRPFDKRFSREIEGRVRAAEMIHSIMMSYTNVWHKASKDVNKCAKKLREARRNLGLFLHHDAITGTARFHVVQDYENKLYEAFENAQFVLQVGAQYLLTKGQLDSADPVLQPELIRDDPRVSSLHQAITVSEDGTRVVVFNPTAQERSEFVEFIVTSADLEIKNSKRQSIPFQINPVFGASTEVIPTSFEIVFLAEIPPLSLETFIFRTACKNEKRYWARIQMFNSMELIVPPELMFEQDKPRLRMSMKDVVTLQNDQISAEFAAFKGTLTKITNKNSNTGINATLDFKIYSSRGSGAYIFFPAGPARDMVQQPPIVRVIRGPFTSEVQAVYQNIFHKSRIYNHPGVQGQGLFVQNALDMTVWNMRDKEIIMRLSTDIKNKDGSFFTDENGFQTIGRKSDFSRPIGTNYYPITTMAILEDTNKRLTLHAGQPHGVASLEQGWLEVMLDRQLLYDDERGLGEGVYDNKLTMTKFILQIEEMKADSAISEKFTYPSLSSIVQNEFLQQPIQKLFTPMNLDVLDLNFHVAKKPLPCYASIVSLKTLFSANYTLTGTSLILHNKGYHCGFESKGLQCPSDTINFKDILPGITKAIETSLTHSSVIEKDVDISSINIPPMEIKSFILL